MPVTINIARCRSKSDRVAFAVHAFMIAEGFKLEAVGEDAEKASSAGVADQLFGLIVTHRLTCCQFAESIQCSEDAVDVSNWNSSTDAYTFLYNPNLWQEGGNVPCATSPNCATFRACADLAPICAAVVTVPLLLKMVNMGDQLLLNWVTLKPSIPEEQQVVPTEPQQLELNVDNYTTSKSGATMQSTCSIH